MSIGDRIKDACHSALSFSVFSTTIFTTLVYAAIFISTIIVYEVSPKSPPLSQQHGLDLGSAYRDLQVIAGFPHPYNSHANSQVREYILSRVTDVAKLYNNVHISDDLTSNATWSAASAVKGYPPGYGLAAVYFEGDNILVKIDGKNSDLDAVLFSAHFDSVSTAPGATDDGMGVVTLLQLVEYFAAHTPKRSVIFNINNGEEDGLNGAHAFLEHRWSSLPKTFLNLEGAGSGGRPILFRTSSESVTRAFVNVPHPHGSVLSSDAFKRGFVKSGTDFSVYTTQGQKGLDLAFYRRRSFYHTKEDSVPNLGGTDSLWGMMEASLFSAIALTEDISGTNVDTPAVYFDVYGEAMAVFTLRTFFIINLVFLIVGPLLVAAAVALLRSQGKLHWSLHGWFRFPLAFILGLGLTFALALLIVYINPFIVYSSGYTVVISLISISIIGLHGPLAFLSSWRHIPQQKSSVLLETYVLWWILLVFDTVMVNTKQVGGLYVITFFHAASFFALIVNFLEHLRLPTTLQHETANIDAEDAEVEVENEEDHTETTPLIHRRSRDVKIDNTHESAHYGFWVLEYLILVPFPVILTAQICVLLLGALPQTLADGNSALQVYLGLALLSFLLLLPLAPFAHNLHRLLPAVFLVILIATGLYNLFVFPFSTASPLKVYFSQSLDLDTGTNLVNITGLAGFVEDKIIPNLPSSWNQTVQCSNSVQKSGLRTCQWHGLAPAVTGTGTKHDWLTFNASLAGPGVARISLKGVNTRSCRIYFDSPVTTVRVDNSTGEIQSDYPMPKDGVSELRLWSRTWDREFVVTAGWQGKAKMTGRVACGWAERFEGIPAYSEVVGFLPPWALVTKANDALVEATHKFSV